MSLSVTIEPSIPPVQLSAVASRQPRASSWSNARVSAVVAIAYAREGADVAIVGAGAWRWSRRREPLPVGPPLDPALEARLNDELRRFDD